jgi:hypothetical protein
MHHFIQILSPLKKASKKFTRKHWRPKFLHTVLYDEKHYYSFIFMLVIFFVRTSYAHVVFCKKNFKSCWHFLLSSNANAQKKSYEKEDIFFPM